MSIRQYTDNCTLSEKSQKCIHKLIKNDGNNMTIWAKMKMQNNKAIKRLEQIENRKCSVTPCGLLQHPYPLHFD